MTVTAAEQYLLELINRARLDPVLEAKLYGINLNAGLAPGTISGAPKQALAHNALLHTAAADHSIWMLDNNTFSHTGVGGSSPGARMTAAGYTFTGSWTWGENIAWAGTTGALNADASINTHHRGLFKSAGHRKNILNDRFDEVGAAQEVGLFSSGSTTFNASMVTQKFAKSGPSGEVFITGVTYNDSDGNKFYSIGEGTGGVSVSAGGSGTTTAFAGGYAVLATAGAVTVTFGGTISATVDASQGNVKLDLVGGDTLLTSADTTLGSGAENARVLGAGKIDITGNSLDNALIGNRANNTLRGEDGNDDLIGQAGIDRLIGGAGNDVLLGGGGRLDVLIGGSGDDIHIGGRGRDVHVGGAGADSFVFNGRFGVDRIKDFGDDDVLWIAHGGAAGFRDVMRNHAENVAAGVKISFGKHAIIIEDITKSDLDPSDFRFDDFDLAMV